MEAYGKILNIVMPIFVLLFFVEKFVEWRRGAQVIRGLDSVSSFSSGITNVVKDVLGLSVSILTYQWLVTHVALVHIEAGWLIFIIAFVAVDFQGYWVHRWSHEINILWNRHVIHHSSEDFNLACALRQSVSTFVNYFTILLLPAALLGVPTEMVAIIGPLHLFLQYWYHTQLIDKMGIVEYFLVTPSHHRVHHAMNKEYLDKNYGQIFILWDRWFGTFKSEMSTVKPIYGITRPARTWNPFKINFQHLVLLWSDAWHTEKWTDKVKLWFMPTGWRPEDVKSNHPVFSISDVYHFEKYDTPSASKHFIAWAWAQMFFNYFLLVYFFACLGPIGIPGIYYYGGFMFLSIYAYTELMDKSRYAILFEIVKSLLILGFIWQSGGDWFGAKSNFGTWYVYIVAGWQVISVGAVLHFRKDF